MIHIDAQLVAAVHAAETPADLYPMLQSAIELEHATIPPYLTGMYSIKPGANPEPYEIIRSVVIEEMLHLTIASNLLNALGGTPVIDAPGFVPTYPGPLPMGIVEGLVVNLAPLSLAVVEDTFAAIEAPDDPHDYPVLTAEALAAPAARADESYSSIGDFYDALKGKIRELGPDAFDRPSHPQVTYPAFFDPDELFPITTADEACHAIDIIVEQGEGTSSGPLDLEGEVSHYYRFLEILKGRRLVRDPSVPEGWSYSGPPVPFDPDGVWPLMRNSTLSAYEPGTAAHRMVSQFNTSYSNLLRALHATFNGAPATLTAAMGLMYELKLQAQEMATHTVTDPRTGETVSVAPAFEYVSGDEPVA